MGVLKKNYRFITLSGIYVKTFIQIDICTYKHYTCICQYKPWAS